ncbi:MAG: hypothetical protein VXY83_01525 [Pseudomonadota bacterium]|nr:hypothetical protein [Magnetococcales bacterium]MEC8066381.1 hypothetical protein [Pseudomonadota bacterium]MEC8467012.1 hypothetical protein [Pseudomonadota bacterium]|tara:strand:- start:2003 stop:2353 length:351 start_codon:yes stop_codon:yes gene_type:complete
MSSIKFVGFTSLLVTMLFVGQVNAQQATIVQGSVASSAGQVKALEEKVESLKLVIKDLNSNLKELGDRLTKAELVNAAINACAAMDPPTVYAGSLLGCVEVKPAPCELCEAPEEGE